MNDREGFFWDNKEPRKTLERVYRRLTDPRTGQLPSPSGNRYYRRAVQDVVDEYGVDAVKGVSTGADAISAAIRSALAWLRESGGYSGDFADSLTMTRAQRVASLYLRRS